MFHAVVVAAQPIPWRRDRLASGLVAVPRHVFVRNTTRVHSSHVHIRYTARADIYPGGTSHSQSLRYTARAGTPHAHIYPSGTRVGTAQAHIAGTHSHPRTGQTLVSIGDGVRAGTLAGGVETDRFRDRVTVHVR